MNPIALAKFFIYLVFFLSIIGCSKDNIEQRGYYNIKTLTNKLDISVQVEIGGVIKKLHNDTDFTKNLVYRSIANLRPNETFVLDSTFVCTQNCQSILNEGDPEMEPIFLRVTLQNDKVKIDTNYNHIYVYNGLIENNRTGKKNYFDQQYHVLTKDEFGNTLINYSFDNIDLIEAK